MHLLATSSGVKVDSYNDNENFLFFVVGLIGVALADLPDQVNLAGEIAAAVTNSQMQAQLNLLG
jgi:hypothetical protein